MEIRPEFIRELQATRKAAKEQYEACTALLVSYGIDPEGQLAPKKDPDKPAFSLRAAIRDVLKGQPPLANAEIMERLKQQGVSVSGSTKLSTRVSIELYNMKNAGQVKMAHGKYRLV